MSAVSKKTKILVMVSGLAFLLSLGVLGGSWYYIDYLQTKLHETKLNTRRAEDEKQQLGGLEKLAVETKDERARLASYIIPDQGVITFLSELENVARKNGVVPSTHTIETVPLAGEKGFEELAVNISLAGTLSDIEKVIRQYENMPYQIRIEHIALHAGGRESGGAAADMLIVVTKMTP